MRNPDAILFLNLRKEIKVTMLNKDTLHRNDVLNIDLSNEKDLKVRTMNDAIKKKYDIAKGDEPLRLFLYSVQEGPMFIQFPFRVMAVLAFSEGDAYNIVRAGYPQGKLLSISQKGILKIQELLDQLNFTVPTSGGMEVKMNTEPVPEKKEAPIIGKEHFVYNMFYIADNFVTDLRDRATLKKIIGKIKLT